MRLFESKFAVNYTHILVLSSVFGNQMSIYSRNKYVFIEEDKGDQKPSIDCNIY